MSLEQFAWDSSPSLLGILLMMPFSTSSGTWNDPIVALFTSTSAVCVTGLGLSIPAFFFLGTIFIRLKIGLYDGNHLSPATGAKFCLRDKVAIQQALDRTGMHDSAQLIRSIIAMTLILKSPVFCCFCQFCTDYGLTKDFG